MEILYLKVVKYEKKKYKQIQVNTIREKEK